MKKSLFLVIALFVSISGYAYDIAVENADGVTIYYNYINEGTELEVTRDGSYYGKVNIPEEVTYKNRTRKVTSIGESVFSGIDGPTSVTIPNSVKNIGYSAFKGCTSLTSLTIGNSVTTIGEKAFRECSGLTSVTIPNSVTSIGFETFYYCTRLKSVTIGNSVKSIGERAFKECYNLTSVTIGNSVKSIGNNAFDGCKNLKKVIFKDIAAWCNIAFSSPYDNPLNYAHHLYSDENTEITDLVIPNSVTSIGKSVFFGCSGLTSVTIPNSVTSIGQNAFYGCSGLTSVTIPNSVTSIGREVFRGCSGLTSVTIPNSVKNIGYSAFFGCSGLTSVISLIKNPFAIDEFSFDKDTYYNATLYVPTGTIEKYKSQKYWNKFIYIEEGEPTYIYHLSANDFHIYTKDGVFYISGMNDGQRVAIYQIDGKQVASANAYDGTANIVTTLSSGTIAIVKIGNKAVKVMMQ